MSFTRLFLQTPSQLLAISSIATRLSFRISSARKSSRNSKITEYFGKSQKFGKFKSFGKVRIVEESENSDTSGYSEEESEYENDGFVATDSDDSENSDIQNALEDLKANLSRSSEKDLERKNDYYKALYDEKINRKSPKKKTPKKNDTKQVLREYTGNQIPGVGSILVIFGYLGAEFRAGLWK